MSVLPNGYAKRARQTKISQLHGVGGAVYQQILGLHVAMQDAAKQRRNAATNQVAIPVAGGPDSHC